MPLAAVLAWVSSSAKHYITNATHSRSDELSEGLEGGQIAKTVNIRNSIVEGQAAMFAAVTLALPPTHTGAWYSIAGRPTGSHPPILNHAAG